MFGMKFSTKPLLPWWFFGWITESHWKTQLMEFHGSWDQKSSFCIPECSMALAFLPTKLGSCGGKLVGKYTIHWASGYVYLLLMSFVVFKMELLNRWPFHSGPLTCAKMFQWTTQKWGWTLVFLKYPKLPSTHSFNYLSIEMIKYIHIKASSFQGSRISRGVGGSWFMPFKIQFNWIRIPKNS